MAGTVKLRIDEPRTLYSGEMLNGSCVATVEKNFRFFLKFGRVQAQSEMCLVQHTVMAGYHQINFTVICTNGSHYIKCYFPPFQVQLMITGMCRYSHIYIHSVYCYYQGSW